MKTNINSKEEKSKNNKNEIKKWISKIMDLGTKQEKNLFRHIDNGIIEELFKQAEKEEEMNIEIIKGFYIIKKKKE